MSFQDFMGFLLRILFALLHYSKYTLGLKYAFCNSPATEPRDAFQIAYASFQIHCGQTKTVSTNGHQKAANVVPILLAVPSLKSSEETADSAGEEDGLKTVTTPDVAPVQIYDDEIQIRLLVCSEANRLVSSMLAFGFFSLRAISIWRLRCIAPSSSPAGPRLLNLVSCMIIACLFIPCPFS